jgi:uncharacterized protein (TIRG00374 family)
VAGAELGHRRARRRGGGHGDGLFLLARATRPKARALSRLLKRLVAAMMLGMLVYAGFTVYRGFSRVADSLRHFTWSAFAFACGLAFSNYLIRFLKWEFYLARLGIRGVPKLDSLLTFLSGLVLTVTPGKVGEVFKSLVLQQTHGVAIARTAPIVLAERLTDVLGVVILIVAGSAGFSGGLGWALVGTLLVVALLIVIASDRVATRLLGMTERGPARLRAVAPKLREAWDSLRLMTAPRALILPTLLSVVAWAMEGLALWVILRGFGESTSVPVACFFYATATLAGALIPVPGGLGVTETMLEEQLHRFGGVGQITGTSAMILVRFATLWFAVLVGFGALAWMRVRHPALMREDKLMDAVGPEARA